MVTLFRAASLVWRGSSAIRVSTRMGRSARYAALLGALAAALFVAHARAETANGARAVTLRWGAPAGCPDGSYVEAEIARLLAGSDAPARTLDAQADVTRGSNGRWHVRLLTRSGGAGGEAGSGERSLDAASCKALADASALIVAMAVDPARVAANQAVAAAEAARVESVLADGGIAGDAGIAANGLDGSSDAAVSPSAASIDAGVEDAASLAVANSIDASARDAGPANAPDAMLEARSAADRSASPASSPTSTVPPATFLVGAAAEADLGTLPYPGVAPMLFAAWTPGAWRVDLAGAYFAKNHTAPLRGGGVGTFQLFSLDLRVCYDLLAASTRSFAARFVLAPCLGGEVASMSGAGEGIQSPSAGSSAWLAVLGGGLVGFRFADAWELDVRLDAAIPLLRPEFRIDASTVHRPAELTVRGMLGVGFRF